MNHINAYERKRKLPCGRVRKLSVEYILDRIVHVLTTGCQWRKLEVVNGSWKTVYHYFSLWSSANLFEHAYHNIVNVYSKVKGLSDQLIVDTSFIKNVFGKDCVGPSPFDRGRNATKVSVITDKYGIPISFSFHKGNKNDSRTLYHTLQKCKLNVAGKKIYADKIYDTENCKSILNMFGLNNCISRKRSITHKADNKTRIVVEHTFSWLDKFRRILVRYDSCIKHLRSFHYIASTQLIGKRLV